MRAFVAGDGFWDASSGLVLPVHRTVVDELYCIYAYMVGEASADRACRHLRDDDCDVECLRTSRLSYTDARDGEAQVSQRSVKAGRGVGQKTELSKGRSSTGTGQGWQDEARKGSGRQIQRFARSLSTRQRTQQNAPMVWPAIGGGLVGALMGWIVMVEIAFKLVIHPPQGGIVAQVLAY